MKNVVFAVILVLLYGCGSEPFTSGFNANVQVEADSGLPPGTGGSVATSTGGAPSAGGASGGSSSTGGAPEVDAGGTGSSQETGGSFHGTGGSSQETGGSSQTGGASATGGVAVVDAGCELVTHEDGVGQTWQDCVPFGTHNEEQALKACEAWSTAMGGTRCVVGSTARCGDSLIKVSALNNAQTLLMEWRWQGPNVGKLTSGAGSVCDVVGTWN